MALSDRSIVLAAFGIIAVMFVAGVFVTQEASITGQATAVVQCSKVCTSPVVYAQWKSVNQQGCITNCCNAQCVSAVAYSQFGATNKQDCIKKCSTATPALTSTGMINVRRIKQVSSIL